MCVPVLQHLEVGRLVHEHVIQGGYESDDFLHCSLVEMYVKCGSMEDAQSVFNKMPIQNVICWTAVIFGHVKCVQSWEALELAQQMRNEGVEAAPMAFVGMLNSCASVAALWQGRHIHSPIIQHGYESDIFVATNLVDMYAKCGIIEDASRVFNKMPTCDVVGWSAVIVAYVKCG
jgi:pentatricopeptide repeat protein